MVKSDWTSASKCAHVLYRNKATVLKHNMLLGFSHKYLKWYKNSALVWGSPGALLPNGQWNNVLHVGGQVFQSLNVLLCIYNLHEGFSFFSSCFNRRKARAGVHDGKVGDLCAWCSKAAFSCSLIHEVTAAGSCRSGLAASSHQLPFLTQPLRVCVSCQNQTGDLSLVRPVCRWLHYKATVHLLASLFTYIFIHLSRKILFFQGKADGLWAAFDEQWNITAMKRHMPSKLFHSHLIIITSPQVWYDYSLVGLFVGRITQNLRPYLQI